MSGRCVYTPAVRHESNSPQSVRQLLAEGGIREAQITAESSQQALNPCPSPKIISARTDDAGRTEWA
jgi:hypothetical protein